VAVNHKVEGSSPASSGSIQEGFFILQTLVIFFSFFSSFYRIPCHNKQCCDMCKCHIIEKCLINMMIKIKKKIDKRFGAEGLLCLSVSQYYWVRHDILLKF
jgi:hypothetical protein